MNDYQSLSHSKWEGKYHVVFIPKYRRKGVYGQRRRHLGEVFRALARQQESVIVEGQLQPDHVHRLLAIPPKYAVAQVWGISKARVRFTSPGRRGAESAILSVSTFGLGGIGSRRSDEIRRRSGATFGTRRRRINGWSN